MATATIRRDERLEAERRAAERMRELQHLSADERRAVAEARLAEIARLFDCD